MSVANQIGFGMCLALVPYLVLSMISAILSHIPPPKRYRPLPMQTVFAEISFMGVVGSEDEGADEQE